MAEVYLVYLGSGSTFEEGVYIEHEHVEAAYSSIDLAMEHAFKWKKNWFTNSNCHHNWRFEDYEDIEYLYDGNTAVVYSVREHAYDDENYERFYCRVQRITVLDKCKEF